MKLDSLDRSPAFFPKLDVLPEDAARVVAAYDRQCAYCAAHADVGVDFLVPQSRGATNHPENLVAACEPCRTARRAKHLDAFLHGRPDLDARAVYARIARATARLRADATRDPSRDGVNA
jgi:5-methylcytosine-specific restriction endonuclease McrA